MIIKDDVFDSSRTEETAEKDHQIKAVILDQDEQVQIVKS